jgi:hypothetical protein
MLALTLLGLNEGFARFFFASGSDGLMSLVTSKIYLRIFLLIFFISMIIFYKRFNQKIIYFIILLVTFFVWCWSGVMIAIFPNGKLLSGWYYFEIKKVDLCKSDIDCEKVFYYETSFKRKSFWTYQIGNKEVKVNIITSPFIEPELDELLRSKFKNSKM